MKFSHLFPLAASLGISGSARAVNVIFTLSGTSTTSVAGATINPGVNLNATQQAAGSMGPRAVSGTITVDVDNVLAPTIIQFVSASLDPADFPGNLQPAPGGSAGSAPAEFGFQFAVPLAGTEFVAWRNSITNVTSSVITVTGGGSYSTTGLSFTLTGGTVDYGQVATGTGNLNSIAAASNTSVAAGSYTVAGNTATLTLPGFDYTYNTAFGAVPGTIRFTGSLTGTATVVPEPAGAGFAAGVLALLVSGRRRRQ